MSAENRKWMGVIVTLVALAAAWQGWTARGDIDALVANNEEQARKLADLDRQRLEAEGLRGRVRDPLPPMEKSLADFVAAARAAAEGDGMEFKIAVGRAPKPNALTAKVKEVQATVELSNYAMLRSLLAAAERLQRFPAAKLEQVNFRNRVFTLRFTIYGS